jgi:phospholipid N-methyltransferase
MDKQDVDRLAVLLQEIRQGQLEQLSIQREHFEIAKTQYDRANSINDRAERIQAKSDALIDRSGKVLKVVIPVLIVLLVAAGWLLFTIP